VNRGSQRRVPRTVDARRDDQKQNRKDAIYSRPPDLRRGREQDRTLQRDRPKACRLGQRSASLQTLKGKSETS